MMKTVWRKRKRARFGVCLLTLLTIKVWLIGCALIGYIAWVLATTVTVKQFLSGSLVFTYAVIGVGFLLFINGLLGWVGATSRSACILRMYIVASVLSVTSEVGGILTLSILRFDMDDILENGWSQVNQVTRNVVQIKFDCCGYTGPKEFAYQNDPIDDSCYRDGFTAEVVTTLQPDRTSNVTDTDHFLKQHGCGPKLRHWFENHKVIWVSIVAAIGLLQVFGVISAMYVLSQLAANVRDTEMLDEFEGRRRGSNT